VLDPRVLVNCSVGNVRELRNVVERGIISSGEGTLRIERPLPRVKAAAVSLMLEDGERSHILRVLKQAGWRIRGREGAAEVSRTAPNHP
jgi:transcriptional regulator of acetoin/glycerol metabolism